MSRTLVAYFSATGTTAKAAEKLAQALEADIYEIKPKVPYTRPDLNWMNRKSRSSVEMNDRSLRPAIITGDMDISGYDKIFLGFPIWWYTAPTLINTFLEAYDFSGREIVLFATAGSSDFGETIPKLQPSAPDARFRQTMVLKGIMTDRKIQALVDACK